MGNPIKISTMRGAGVSFLIAALLFVALGQPLVFGLIPAGGLVGLGVGSYLSKHPSTRHSRAAEQPINGRTTEKPGWLAKILLHPNLLARTGGLVACGIVLLLAAWCAGYYLLPEGALRGGADAAMARSGLEAPSATPMEEWGRIFRANLIAAAALVLGSLLIRVNRVPFGYFAALFNITGYGLYLGTNSFAVPMPERMAPSLAVLSRSGPYEMLALLILAAASSGWAFFEIQRIFRTNPARVQPRPRVQPVEIFALAVGLILLAAANWMEASMVMAGSL